MFRCGKDRIFIERGSVGAHAGAASPIVGDTRHFRAGLERAAFSLKPGEHPIIRAMLGDAVLAGHMADQLLQQGVYVIGFSFPVGLKGQARVRTQVSAALTRERLDQAIGAFVAVGRELGVVP